MRKIIFIFFMFTTFVLNIYCLDESDIFGPWMHIKMYQLWLEEGEVELVFMKGYDIEGVHYRSLPATLEITGNFFSITQTGYILVQIEKVDENSFYLTLALDKENKMWLKVRMVFIEKNIAYFKIVDMSEECKRLDYQDESLDKDNIYIKGTPIE